MNSAKALIVFVSGVEATAAVCYLCRGDWRRGVFWLAAVAINLVVTF